MKIGIIGLPNVGKSSLFKALTRKQVAIADYPFTTIEPNVGVVAVPDERLEAIFKISESAKVVPAIVEFVDIAGLVKGAHQGEGLGNKFLSHIREVDALVHLVRAFGDNPTPEKDIEVINLELIMADLQTVEKHLETLRPKIRGQQEQAIAEAAVVEKAKKILEEGKSASELTLEEEEKNTLKLLNLLTLKPILVVYNIPEEKIKGRDLVQGEALCAKLEAELADLGAEEIRELGYEQTGLDKLIKASYKILDLITFYSYNEKECHAWTIKQGAKAPEAAGRIHTDFAKGFIKAEVISSNELLQAGFWLKAKDLGLVRTEGKDYVVQDGDVIYFYFT